MDGTRAECVPVTRTETGRSLASYLAPHGRSLAIGAILLLATNVADKSIPWMLRHAIDGLVASDFGAVRLYAVAVLGVAAVMWLARTGSRVWIFNVGRDVELDLRNELLERVHRLGAAFFRRMSAGDAMSRATNDLGQVRLLVGFGLLQGVNAILGYAGAFTLMLLTSPSLAAWALLPYPVLVLVTWVFGRSIHKQSRVMQETLASLSERAQESLSGIRVVRAFSLEAHEAERFDRANQSALRASMRLVLLRGSLWPLLGLTHSVGTIIVLWRGGTMVLEGTLTVGQFAAFNAYLTQLIWPSLAFGFLLSVVQRGRASYARVREVLDAVPEIDDYPDARRAPLEGEGAVEVRTLSFSHDPRRADAPTLDHVSLGVSASSSIAIVGRTGSGKSTLAALLARLLPTPPGAVFLDGEDVTELRLRDVRKRIGFAQQDPFLFSTTVARNIAFALDDPDAPNAMDRVRGAAEAASVLDEIERLPDGFDTIVGERGVQLSGGQKQRIALARALLNEPRVLVLDDPLSAVDARTEATILEALDRAGEGRTLVLVTHRIAAAARAASVVVLERGRVVERGTHDELLDRGGIYAEIAAQQRLEAELFAGAEPLSESVQ